MSEKLRKRVIYDKLDRDCDLNVDGGVAFEEWLDRTGGIFGVYEKGFVQTETFVESRSVILRWCLVLLYNFINCDYCWTHLRIEGSWVRIDA